MPFYALFAQADECGMLVYSEFKNKSEAICSTHALYGDVYKVTHTEYLGLITLDRPASAIAEVTSDLKNLEIQADAAKRGLFVHRHALQHRSGPYHPYPNERVDAVSCERRLQLAGLNRDIDEHKQRLRSLCAPMFSYAREHGLLDASRCVHRAPYPESLI